MLYSRAQVTTSEPIEMAFELIKGAACVGGNTTITNIDEINYRIQGKSQYLRRSFLHINFYIILKKYVKGTKIEIYDEYPIFFKPDRRLLDPLVDSIGKKISFTSRCLIDKVNREKTNDGWIITNDTDESIWSQIDEEDFKTLN